jgi:hypothetical protein
MPEVVVDWTDPCSRAQRLREAFYALVSGAQAYEIAYTANGVTRSVKYSVINTSLLMSQLRQAESECALLSGTAVPAGSKRVAIQCGARRGRRRIVADGLAWPGWPGTE